MKKFVPIVLSSLLVFTLTTEATAETKKSVAPKSSVSAVAPMKTVIGAYMTPVSNTIPLNGMDGTLKIGISKDMDALVGGSIVSSNTAGSTTQLRLLLVGIQNYAGSFNTVNPHWAGMIHYVSGAANVSGLSILNVGVGWGISAALGSNASLQADIYLVQYSSSTGPTAATTFTNWTILAPTFGISYAL